MSKLGLAFVLTAVLGVIGWSSQIAIASQQAELRGTVTVNGETPPPGVEIVARLADGTECGRTRLEEGGAYRFALSGSCPAESSVQFFLAATGDQAATDVTVKGDVQTADIAFEDLPPESLQAIGPGVPAAAEAAKQVVDEAAKQALADRIDRPLVTSDNLFALVLVVVGAVAGLLALMVGATLWSHLKDKSPGEMGFSHQIQAMVLVMVVVAVIILGVTDKVDPEGLVAILGAIAGYGVGRAVGGVSTTVTPPAGTSTPEPTTSPTPVPSAQPSATPGPGGTPSSSPTPSQ
jgi:hypothetical protein